MNHHCILWDTTDICPVCFKTGQEALMDELQAWESDTVIKKVPEICETMEKREEQEMDLKIKSDTEKVSVIKSKNLPVTSARVGNKTKQKKLLTRKTRNAIKSASQLGLQLKDFIFVRPKKSQFFFD